MGLTFRLLITLILWYSVECSKIHKFRDPAARQHNQEKPGGRTITSYNYGTYYYNVSVDHFSYSTMDKFPLKYLANYTYFNKDNGTIFFYTGNEGTIEGFAEATGIMWDLAPMFNAALVFAEHRYYGESLPYANISYQDVAHLGYLNSIQALADFAQLIPYLKREVLKCSDTTPVIAFGGSYGAMLSVWMRIKYPHLINGVWSGSAPLMYSKGGNTPLGAFENVTTRTFVESGCSREGIVKGWEAIRNLGKSDDGRKFLNELFQINETSLLINDSNAEWVVQFVREAIEYMGMVDYPYYSEFLMPMPAWPVKEFCKYVNQSEGDDKTLATQMYKAANVYYNFTGNETSYCVNPTVCGDTATSGLGSPLGWPWQACTEQLMEMCAQGGDNDMFWDECSVGGGPMAQNLAYCRATFGDMGFKDEMMDEDAIPRLYGMDFSATSNIIFTNGYLDPWCSGGVYESSPGVNQAIKNGVYTFLIPASAHHLDLRQPNTCDPRPVRNARFQIVNILSCYAYGCATMPEAQPLPPADENSQTDNCQFQVGGYPWGESAAAITTSNPSASTAPNSQTTTSSSHSNSVTKLFYFLLCVAFFLNRL